MKKILSDETFIHPKRYFITLNNLLWWLDFAFQNQLVDMSVAIDPKTISTSQEVISRPI